MRALSCLAVALACHLSGCSVRPRDIGREPEMSAVGSGIVVPKAGLSPDEPQRPKKVSGNSTWSYGSADLFRDARAIRRGDILTVKISVKDRASLDSSANRSRDSKTDLKGRLGFGIDAFGIKKEGESSLDTGATANTSSEGRGGVSRSETIDLSVAATVVDILANGNLVISGSQELRVNYEMRVLNVAGIVRPRDISTDNSVSYEKVAEARVSYGGRGRVMEVQQPALGHQLIDLISPF